MRAQDPIPFFEALYDETYRTTLRLVTRGCADADRIPDLMQDIYADVYAAILTHGTAYFTNPAGFVRRIARHKLSEWYGLKAKLRCMVPLRTLDGDGEEYDLPELATEVAAGDAAETKLLAAQAAERLKTFAPETRRIILCRVELDMPFPQIAKLLGMKEATVKMRYYRALAELRELYQKEGADL